eukprot:6209874-Pleurochrysis_carterae.AAC.2
MHFSRAPRDSIAAVEKQRGSPYPRAWPGRALKGTSKHQLLSILISRMQTAGRSSARKESSSRVV